MIVRSEEFEMFGIIFIPKEQVLRAENEKLVRVRGKEYKLVKEKLKPGDMYWMAITGGRVEFFKDVDYRHFNPNEIGAWKLIEI